MRDVGVYNVARAMPRMSWHPRNLYNLWQCSFSPKKKLDFKTSNDTLFQQRWKAKAAVRAYHGDYIPEKIFKRWYIPDNLPNIRPKKVVKGDDKESLEEFAGRKQREDEYETDEAVYDMAPVGSLMFAEVERRIDTIVFRSCFAHSIYEARRLVVHGYVMLNGKKHQNANTRLKPGDMITVDHKAIRFFKPPRDDCIDNVNATEPNAEKLTPFHLPLYASPWLFIPSYIEPNFATCSAIYVRHPTARPGYSEIPTPYDADGEVVRLAWEWYTKRGPRIRSKTRLARMPEDRAYVPELREQAESRRIQQQVLARRAAAAGFGIIRTPPPKS